MFSYSLDAHPLEGKRPGRPFGPLPWHAANLVTQQPSGANRLATLHNCARHWVRPHKMRSALLALLEYLIGFIALAFFAYLAFGRGHPTDESFIFAFKASSLLALIELTFLIVRTSPANRLILAANVWLIAGGVAAFFEQWWWLRIYQQFGEASLFFTMLLVGVVFTLSSPAGFIAKLGPKASVVHASLVLLAAVCFALAAAMYFRGNVKYAAVIPVIALSWLNRLLRHRLPSVA